MVYISRMFSTDNEKMDSSESRDLCVTIYSGLRHKKVWRLFVHCRCRLVFMELLVLLVLIGVHIQSLSSSLSRGYHLDDR